MYIYIYTEKILHFLDLHPLIHSFEYIIGSYVLFLGLFWQPDSRV